MLRLGRQLWVLIGIIIWQSCAVMGFGISSVHPSIAVTPPV